jgi:putative SOS response-associated peptidase YedK
MCRVFAANLDWDAIASIFDVDTNDIIPESLPQRSFQNVPKHNIAIIAAGNDGHRHMRSAYWSLIPQWSKTVGLTYPTYNARVESAADKPAFAQAAISQRAIIPCSGYYEFKNERPFYFHNPDDAPLLMAGLFSWWRAHPQEPWKLTATILTRQAFAGPASVHHRMPLLLAPGSTDIWLDRTIAGPAILKQTAELSVAIGERLKFHEVQPFELGDDGPELIKPYEQQKLENQQARALFDMPKSN